LFSAGFHLSSGQQIAVLDLPEVRRAIVFQRREVIVMAAQAMIERGLGHNATALALDIPASSLCQMLQTFRERGLDGLRPKIKTKPTGTATACRLTIYVGL
jgi:hypothetical protein